MMISLEQCVKQKFNEYMLFLLLDKDIGNGQHPCTRLKSFPSIPTEFPQFCPTELFLSLLECEFLKIVYSLYFLQCQTEGGKIAILDVTDKYNCSKKSVMSLWSIIIV